MDSWIYLTDRPLQPRVRLGKPSYSYAWRFTVTPVRDILSLNDAKLPVQSVTLPQDAVFDVVERITLTADDIGQLVKEGSPLSRSRRRAQHS